MDGQKQDKKHRRNLTKAKLSPLPRQPMLEGVTLPSPRMHNRAAKEVEISPTFRDLESDMAVWALYDRWCLHYNIRRTAEEMDWSGDEEMTLTPTERDLESKEAVLDLYYRWCLYHKILRTPEEMQQRFNNFKMSALYAFKMNQKDPSCHFSLSDWCDKIELHYSSGIEEMSLTPTKGDLKSDEALMDLYRRWCLHHKIQRTPEEMQLGLRSFGKGATQAFEMSQKDPTVQFCLSIWCDETDYHPVYEATFLPTERDLKSGNALLGLYHRYCHGYEIYRTPEEMQQRFNNFKKSAIHVFEKNKKDSSCSFYLSPFCDEKDSLDQAADSVSIRPTFRDLASRDAVMALYKRWCLNQNISRTPEEMDERFHIFKERAQLVFDRNFENPGTCSMNMGCDEKIDWASLAFSSSDEE